MNAIEALIREAGPLPLARVMALAAEGYYANRQPFGAGGDFVTAPEVSQMFGELVGLWCADLWQRAGSPATVRLVELGPGRGTLMADALRATRGVPGFHAALSVHLVERSARLRAEQRARVPDATWHDALADVPADAPTLLIANEFFDALPISQIERTADGWRLRGVAWGLDAPALVPMADDAEAAVPPVLRGGAAGSVFERGFAGEALAAQLARRLAASGGAALIVDYGYMGPALGDTLQAIHEGAFVPAMTHLGKADLSAHVDFAALARAAKAAADVVVHGPADQGAFLARLGLRQRADALKADKSVEVRARVEAAVARLAGIGAMGRLFKAMAMVGGGWPEPAGFGPAGFGPTGFDAGAGDDKVNA